MNRRELLSLAPAALLGAAAGRAPNIIWIMADDLGWGDVGCYGQKLIRTPHIDRMASEGMRFTDAYAGCSVCAPSRSVLMTGMHGGHTSVRSNPGGVPLLPTDVTVAELLKKAGYATGLFGKWGLGDVGTATTAIRKGFDTHVGFLHQAHAHFQYPRFIYSNDREFPLEGNSETSRRTYANDVCMEKALGFIREQQRGPFFAYLSITMPHYEPHVPDDSMKEYRGKFPETTPWSTPNGRLKAQPELRAAFAAMVSRVDRYTGQVLALLKELNIDKDTIVFFTSDNGSLMAGENYFNSSGPFRGHKGDMYEGGLRVPMIARWPSRVPAGKVSSFPWAFHDFLPTAANLAGIRSIPRCDGVSIRPTLMGQSQKAERAFYWELPRYDRKSGSFADELPPQAMRRGKLKVVRPKPNAPVEVFDLNTDLGERHDLAGTRPSLAKELERAMLAMRTPPRPQKEPDHGWWEARA